MYTTVKHLIRLFVMISLLCCYYDYSSKIKMHKELMGCIYFAWIQNELEEICFMIFLSFPPPPKTLQYSFML